MSQQRNPVEKLLIDMARFYDYDLEERQLDLFLEVLAHFPVNEVLQGGARYMRNTKNSRFPIPVHKIVAHLVPDEESDEAKAQAIASRIQESISKFGWCNSQAAREHIGELGWDVVQRFGGWPYICENHGLALQPGQFYAQVRDVARASIEQVRAGTYGQAIAIEGPGNVQGQIPGRPQGLQQAGDVLGGILAEAQSKKDTQAT